MEPLVVSHSELSSFKRCRRQWWLGTYRALRLRDEVPTGAREIGNRVHLALSGLYGYDLDPLAILAISVEDDIRRYPQAERDIQRDADLCQAMLEGYMYWLEEDGEDENLDFLSTEKNLAAPLTEGITIVGKIDARIRRRTDGALLFMDHKTTGNFADIEKTASVSEQMLQYHLLEYLEALERGKTLSETERTDGGIFNMLRKVKRTAAAKPPFYKRHEVQHNVEELRSYWLRVVGTAHEVQRLRRRLDAGEEPRVVAYPSPTGSCSWDCDFWAICPMFDDGSDVENVVADLYKQGDPYERYRVDKLAGIITTLRGGDEDG